MIPGIGGHAAKSGRVYTVETRAISGIWRIAIAPKGEETAAVAFVRIGDRAPEDHPRWEWKPTAEAAWQGDVATKREAIAATIEAFDLRASEEAARA